MDSHENAKPTISLCVIARDEESVLPRCLRSAEHLADQVLLVDTGSSDGTVAVAHALGAEVVEFSWCDDFAAARNAGLERCTGDYVLMLDADEWIEHGCEGDTLKATLESSLADAFSVVLIDHLDGGGERRYPLVRLFRNRSEYRYRGAIHEQITPSIARHAGESEIVPQVSGLSVGHDGYLRERREAKNKPERNLALLRAWVERNPEDPAAHYFLGRELTPMRNGRAVPGAHLQEALGHFEWIASHGEGLTPALAADAARLHAAALIGELRLSEAAAVLSSRADDSVACDLLRSDVDMMSASGRKDVLERALARVVACYDRQTRDRGPLSEPALSGPVARAHAAEILGGLHRVEEARELAEEAARMSGAGAAAWNAMVTVAITEANVQSALNLALRAIRADPIDPWAWANLGTLLLMSGKPADALEPLGNALRLAPGWNEVQRMHAFAADGARDKIGA